MNADEVIAFINSRDWAAEAAEGRANLAERRAASAADEWAVPASHAPTPEPEPPPVIKAHPVAHADAWAKWVDKRIDREVRAITGAVADVLAEERRAWQAAIAELRAENETLDGVIAMLQKQVTELAARLDRPPAPHLRAVE
jgi:hypothetical protein